MEEIKPIEYEKWQKQEGGEVEFGTQSLITWKIQDRLIELENKIGELMGKSLARSLFTNGRRFKKLETEIEQDASLRADKIYAFMKTVQGDLPIEYLGMAHNAWLEEYTRRLNWENKSLWQYIEYWLRRKFSRGINDNN